MIFQLLNINPILNVQLIFVTNLLQTTDILLAKDRNLKKYIVFFLMLAQYSYCRAKKLIGITDNLN